MPFLHHEYKIGFEWDDDKARTNQTKHGVAFQEAIAVFADAPRAYLILRTPRTKYGILVIGRSDRGRLLLVVATD